MRKPQPTRSAEARSKHYSSRPAGRGQRELPELQNDNRRGILTVRGMRAAFRRHAPATRARHHATARLAGRHPASGRPFTRADPDRHSTDSNQARRARPDRHARRLSPRTMALPRRHRRPGLAQGSTHGGPRGHAHRMRRTPQTRHIPRRGPLHARHQRPCPQGRYGFGPARATPRNRHLRTMLYFVKSVFRV